MDAPNIFSSVIDSSQNLGSVMTNTGKDLSRDELVSEMVPKVQDILNRTFPDVPQKRGIKIYRDRVSFACPLCGDSASNMSKKRGSLILEGKFKNLYKCHNCGVCMTTYRFFRNFNENLSNRAIDYMISNKGEIEHTSISTVVTNMLYDTDIIDEYAIAREDFKQRCHLMEVNGTYAGTYLAKRLQFKSEKFLYHMGKNLLFVLNLTPSGKILGLQVRSLDQNRAKGGSKYLTYKLSKIYEVMLHEEKSIPDEIEEISTIFNILLVNYNEPVTVVEGPMDSFFVRNCIATCGANHNIDLNMTTRYLFDDDLAGRKHAIEKLGEGYAVFMWDKMKKDLCMPWRKKWDVNDLVIWGYSNGVKVPKFDRYFSSNSLDLLSI